MIHLGPNLTRRENEADRSARRRAEAVTKMFGGPASTHGQRFDFSNPSAPAMPTSGTGSLADLYQPAFRAEIVKRDELARRMDRLPPKVQQLSQTCGLDIDALEVVGIVVRDCAILGGQARVFPADVGRALGISTQKVEAIIADAVARKLIEARPGHQFRSKL